MVRHQHKLAIPSQIRESKHSGSAFRTNKRIGNWELVSKRKRSHTSKATPGDSRLYTITSPPSMGMTPGNSTINFSVNTTTSPARNSNSFVLSIYCTEKFSKFGDAMKKMPDFFD